MQTNSVPAGPAIPNALSLIYFPYTISFKDTAASPAIRFQIEQYLGKLSQVYDRITDVRVTVQIPHKRSGIRFFHINIQLDLPGKRLAVSREPEIKEERTDIYTAISSAFHKIVRQVEDFRSLHQRGRVRVPNRPLAF